MKVKGDLTSGDKHCSVRLVCNAVRGMCGTGEIGDTSAKAGSAVPRDLSRGESVILGAGGRSAKRGAMRIARPLRVLVSCPRAVLWTASLRSAGGNPARLEPAVGARPHADPVSG